MYIGGHPVTWKDLEAYAAGTMRGKHLHFGSCSVMPRDGTQRQEFRESLGARSISGFTKQVHWFESLAFELLHFDALTFYDSPKQTEDYLKKVAGDLWTRTGFVLTRK